VIDKRIVREHKP